MHSTISALIYILLKKSWGNYDFSWRSKPASKCEKSNYEVAMSDTALFTILVTLVTAIFAYLQKQISDLKLEILSLKVTKEDAVKERNIVESVLNAIAIIVLASRNVSEDVKNAVQTELKKLEDLKK